MTAHALNRRDLLKLSALGAAAVALPLERVVSAKSASRIASSKLPRPYTLPFKVPPVIKPVRSDATTDYYHIAQRTGVAEILPGVKTPVFGYEGISPGPTIRATRGREVVLRMTNELPARHPRWGYEAWTSCHLHGSASLPQYDGYASDITRPGQVKTYRYPNTQDARTLWYHDHGVHHTAENAYMGLAAQYHLVDPLEQSLPIPKGDYEAPLILTDKIFNSNGEFIYDDNGHSGLYGDVILVNGVPWPLMKVEQRKYRFRVLNASLARGFRLQLSTRDPMTVIGTDGGLMVRPQTTAQLRLGMAERYEIVIDFAKYKPGQRVELRNLGVKNSVDYDNTGKIMAFEVTGPAKSLADNAVSDPDGLLNPQAPAMDLAPAMAVQKRKLEVERKNGQWVISGTTWADVVKSDYRKVVAKPKLDTVEQWEIVNKSGGWFHPVHIHLVDFKIIERNGKAPFNYELGPKDVVYVGENETVKVLARFGPHKGRYMIHCHNLPHEDHDMMTQFEVVGDSEGEGDDPITSAPPYGIPDPLPDL
ncbi:multicopper oxidase domain-containing protein [Pseudonocardia bannensis]|uniref:Multicopper oxidase domain-containing protein n=1 Tax=Pseudonocardia bannensis TaxID=630973 RepID=A0A848DMC1_9PSEU|nr:multicopper oxidase domain-containing protein [Pseudonocardia bannensis]NMH93646.1 multicopper oxidase domain-containing protein [Pseudonocardia bannensis]